MLCVKPQFLTILGLTNITFNFLYCQLLWNHYLPNRLVATCIIFQSTSENNDPTFRDLLREVVDVFLGLKYFLIYCNPKGGHYQRCSVAPIKFWLDCFRKKASVSNENTYSSPTVMKDVMTNILNIKDKFKITRFFLYFSKKIYIYKILIDIL